jgi:hypothetical protein
MTHGDDKGLVLPPRVAPKQVSMCLERRNGLVQAHTGVCWGVVTGRCTAVGVLPTPCTRGTEPTGQGRRSVRFVGPGGL